MSAVVQVGSVRPHNGDMQSACRMNTFSFDFVPWTGNIGISRPREASRRLRRRFSSQRYGLPTISRDDGTAKVINHDSHHMSGVVNIVLMKPNSRVHHTSSNPPCTYALRYIITL